MVRFLAIFLAFIPQLAFASTLSNADGFRQTIIEYLGSPTPDGYWTEVTLLSRPNFTGYEAGFVSGISIPEGYDFETEADVPFVINHNIVDSVAITSGRSDVPYVVFRWDRDACPIAPMSNTLLNWSETERSYSLAFFNGTNQPLFLDTNKRGNWTRIPEQRPNFTELIDDAASVINIRTEPDHEKGKQCGVVSWYPANIK